MYTILEKQVKTRPGHCVVPDIPSTAEKQKPINLQNITIRITNHETLSFTEGIVHFVQKEFEPIVSKPLKAPCQSIYWIEKTEASVKRPVEVWPLMNQKYENHGFRRMTFEKR